MCAYIPATVLIFYSEFVSVKTIVFCVLIEQKIMNHLNSICINMFQMVLFFLVLPLASLK